MGELKADRGEGLSRVAKGVGDVEGEYMASEMNDCFRMRVSLCVPRAGIK